MLTLSTRELSAFFLWLAQHGHATDVVWRRLADVVAKTLVVGCAAKLGAAYRGAFTFGSERVGAPSTSKRCFELLGFDVMLDAQVRCYSFLCSFASLFFGLLISSLFFGLLSLFFCFLYLLFEPAQAAPTRSEPRPLPPHGRRARPSSERGCRRRGAAPRRDPCGCGARSVRGGRVPRLRARAPVAARVARQGVRGARGGSCGALRVLTAAHASTRCTSSVLTVCKQYGTSSHESG